MKALYLILFLTFGFSSLSPAQEEQEYLYWTKEPDDDCELKKLNGKVWDKVDPQTIADEPITIEKEYESGSITFKIANDWYGTQRKCLESVPNPFELKNGRRGLFLFGYQKNHFINQIVGDEPNESVDETWVGLIVGIQNDYYKGSSGFRLHDGVDLELGQSIMNKEQILSIGARVFGGIGMAFSDRFLMSLEPGVLIRYGQFPVGGSNFFIRPQVGFIADYRISPKQSIRLGAGVPLFEKNYFLSAGVVSDIP